MGEKKYRGSAKIRALAKKCLQAVEYGGELCATDEECMQALCKTHREIDFVKFLIFLKVKSKGYLDDALSDDTMRDGFNGIDVDRNGCIEPREYCPGYYYAHG